MLITDFFIGQLIVDVVNFIYGFFNLLWVVLITIPGAVIFSVQLLPSLITGFPRFINALLTYEFMQNAFFSAILIGIICSVVGVFVLLRGMVFLGQAIAHTAFAGAALAILMGWDPLQVILIFSVLSSIGIGYVNEKKVMKNEVIVGIVFSFFMALAVLFIGMLEQYSTDVNSILFGNILLIKAENLRLLIIFSIIILFVLYVIRKELFAITFDPIHSAVIGIPVRFIDYLFLIMISLTISVSLRAIGAILVFAMIVTPAAAAYQLSYRLKNLILLATTFGVISGVLGLYLAYALNLPSGSTIVTVVTIIFVICFIFSPKRKTAKLSPADCPYCQEAFACEDCDEPECIHGGIKHRHEEDILRAISINREDLPEKEELTKHKHDRGKEQ